MGAYGGRAEIMNLVAPLGPMYQAGTLSGNPLAMSAGIATLDLLAVPGFYESLDARAKRLGDGITRALRDSGAPATAVRVASLLTLFFSGEPVRDYAASLGWDKTAPAPQMPDAVIAATSARYVEAYENITGLQFSDWPG